MSNCSFADQSPSLKGKYYTAGRTLDGVTYRQRLFTVHQQWGEMTNQNLVNYFNSLPPESGASCNYCCDKYGNLGLVVDESNRSWCSSSRVNDIQACTVECASEKKYPYKMTDACLEAVKNLCIDWCKRNGIRKMHWIPDLVPYKYPNPSNVKVGDGGVDSVKKVANEAAVVNKLKALPDDEGLFTVHHWYYNKPCPGDYAESKLQGICDAVNAAIGENIKVGDIVLMEVTEIKDGYAYGKVRIDEPVPPVPHGIVVGSKVTINPGAKVGGLTDKRGQLVNTKYANGKYIDKVNKIETHLGVEEGRLEGIVTWVAIDSLTLVE